MNSIQLARLSPGEIDLSTGRKVRLHIGNIKDKNPGGKDELYKTCNQGAKNITGEKPSAIWLLCQIRRAGLDEQKAAYDWLAKNFGK